MTFDRISASVFFCALTLALAIRLLRKFHILKPRAIVALIPLLIVAGMGIYNFPDHKWWVPAGLFVGLVIDYLFITKQPLFSSSNEPRIEG